MSAPQGVAIHSNQLYPVQHQSNFQDNQSSSHYYSNQTTDFAYIVPRQENVCAEPNHQQFQGRLPQPSAIEDNLALQRPTAPSILYMGERNITYALPIQYIDIVSELHVATAFVRMKITFHNTTNKSISGLFVLPTKGTVTSCEVSLNDSRYVQTTFVSKEDESKLAKKQKKKKKKQEEEVELHSMYPCSLRKLTCTVSASHILVVCCSTSHLEAHHALTCVCAISFL